MDSSKEIVHEGISRRKFLKNSSRTTAGIIAGASFPLQSQSLSMFKGNKTEIEIVNVNSNFEREPLIRPFGFKGGYMSEIWQTVAFLESAKGQSGLGLCTQSVLWSDASVFASNSEAGGNALMYAISERALQMARGLRFSNPLELQEKILDDLYEDAKAITNNPALRKTFALNALVGVDNAAWLLYANENGIRNFDEMIPEAYKKALSYRHERVASIPLMAYTVPIKEIVDAVDAGYFFMKIKIGQPGTQREMLEKDKERLTAIHKAIGDRRTPYTSDGKLPYYFDANGRYESKDTLLRLLDHAKKIGAYNQIAVIEEPFPEETDIDVHDIEIRLAADESAHTDEDARIRIAMGYRAIALKAIAKTLSMTLKIAKVAHEQNVPCFCADLTVNPILVEWNKAVACRLAPFPGLGMGLLETNGHQNYKRWDTMRSYHPEPEAPWANTRDGIFVLGEDYYQADGGIFRESEHYRQLVQSPFRKH